MKVSLENVLFQPPKKGKAPTIVGRMLGDVSREELIQAISHAKVDEIGLPLIIPELPMGESGEDEEDE
jgi:hypothetical protein